jgi:hypothetical protein
MDLIKTPKEKAAPEKNTIRVRVVGIEPMRVDGLEERHYGNVFDVVDGELFGELPVALAKDGIKAGRYKAV